MEQSLLLVDDEANVISSLKRLLRRDGYYIFTATSGEEGLNLLERHPVAVVISDQRMPFMTGAEFLRQVKALYPHTVRIMLSGHTEQSAVADSIRDGEIDKFLTKPWDDDQLLVHVRDAFHHFLMMHETLRRARQVMDGNADSAQAGGNDGGDVPVRASQASQAALDSLPVAVLGLEFKGAVACANKAACALLSVQSPRLMGRPVGECLPAGLQELLLRCSENSPMVHGSVRLNGKSEVKVCCMLMDPAISPGGRVVILTR